MAGTLGVAGFGVWLVGLGHWGYGTAWVDVAIALLATVAVVGTLAGQPAKRPQARQPSAAILLGIIVDMLLKPGT